MTSLPATVPPVTWPEGRPFAFTVFDDTDLQTVANGKPVYDLLKGLGFRTTKSVWPLAGKQPARLAGDTCEDPAFLAWTLELQDDGFEIAVHGATYHTSPREDTADALRAFRDHYGHDPKAHANHSRNLEAIYWGDARLTGWHRWLYNGLTRFRSAGRFEGHLPTSRLFWGDLCQASITYVRNFVFDEVDTLKACPIMPYHDPARPYVRRWFASSDGPDAEAYVRMLSPANLDRLEQEHGACIMYAHFGDGFAPDGTLHPGFVHVMEDLARRGGWYVPVGTLLDHIEAQRGEHVLTPQERSALERRWLAQTVRLRLKAALR